MRIFKKNFFYFPRKCEFRPGKTWKRIYDTGFFLRLFVLARHPKSGNTVKGVKVFNFRNRQVCYAFWYIILFIFPLIKNNKWKRKMEPIWPQESKIWIQSLKISLRPDLRPTRTRRGSNFFICNFRSVIQNKDCKGEHFFLFRKWNFL